jgi:DNA-binding FrmR family transcriptional regulator
MSTDALKRACEDGTFCHKMAFQIAAERDSLNRALKAAIHELGQQFKLREAAEAELAKAHEIAKAKAGEK